jgi:Tfp pilus assembly protein PilN
MWVTVGVVVVALQAPAVLMLRQLGRQSRELQQGLAAAEQQRASIQARSTKLALEHAEVQRQIALAERLCRKHRWSELFAALSECVPETAILTRLETDPPTASATGAPIVHVRGPGAKAEDDRKAANVASGLVISGVAVDHDSVATFLRNLNNLGQVGQCTLESTLRQPFLNGEGVSFTIRTQW